MTQPETEVDGLEVAINDLAFRSLNNVPYIAPESLEEAVDTLGQWIRKGSLGITLALLEISKAVENASRRD